MTDPQPFFVFGCLRSGTTLVRLMLDSHPHLTVPPESHFVVQGPGPTEDVGAALERILAHPRFQEWELTADRVRDEVRRRKPVTYADLVDCVFGLYARERGKQRWGDKTPRYAFYGETLLDLFPGAQFIHVIRDGREVAASIYAHGWTGSVVSAADQWRRTLTAGRRWARLGADRYREIRLDHLIANPEGTLRDLCSFLGEPFAPEMLWYHRDARSRVRPAEWQRADHRGVEQPPTRGLRDWQAGLSPQEREAVQAVCHGPLKRLGIETPRPPLAARARAAGHVLRSRMAERLRPEWRPDRLDRPQPARHEVLDQAGSRLTAGDMTL